MAKNIIEESLNIDLEDSTNVAVFNNQDILPVETSVEVTKQNLKDNSTIDYNNARDNIIDMIETGTGVLPDLASLAKDSESARVYEVLSTSIKTLAEMQKTLLELTKQQQENVIDTNEKSNTTNNNNLYVQSTEDLLKTIKDRL